MAVKAKQHIDVFNGFTTNIALSGKFHVILNPKHVKSLKREDDWVIATIKSKPQIKIAVSADNETLEDLMEEIQIH